MNTIKTIWIFAAVLLCIGKGCVQKDTCNIGETFTDMFATVSDSMALLHVEIVWNTERTLPLEYFQDYQIYRSIADPSGDKWQNDWSVLDSINVDLGKFDLYLNAAPVMGSTRRFDFHLAFPDRREYLDCDHPGSADLYKLDVSIAIEHGSAGFKVSAFEWDEELLKGGI